MEVVGGIVAAVLALVALDRLVARGVLDRRERRRRATSAGGSGALGELIEVFQPSITHLTQERDRQRNERQQTGDAAPGLDLDAGTADLRRRDDQDPSAS